MCAAGCGGGHRVGGSGWSDVDESEISGGGAYARTMAFRASGDAGGGKVKVVGL